MISGCKLTLSSDCAACCLRILHVHVTAQQSPRGSLAPYCGFQLAHLFPTNRHRCKCWLPNHQPQPNVTPRLKDYTTAALPDPFISSPQPPTHLVGLPIISQPFTAFVPNTPSSPSLLTSSLLAPLFSQTSALSTSPSFAANTCISTSSFFAPPSLLCPAG